MSSSNSRNTDNPWSSFKTWAGSFGGRRHEETAFFVLTLLIGAIVGLVVVAFILVTENLGSRMYPGGGAAWRRVAIPTLGALVTGFLLYRHFPNARGSGIPQTKTAFFLRGGVIYFRTVIGKFFCSAISLASGIALGREGPSVQVGAGIGSTLGRRMGLSPSRIKALVPIASSAALAAAFNTPIAAVLFTLEEIMGDLNAPVLGAIVLSSATSWMVLHLLLGDEPLFHVPAYQLVHPIEFLFYAALGVAGGLVSVSFVKLLLWLRKGFLRMPQWTAPFQPVAGGLLVGLLGWYVPDVLGVGYNHVSQALNGQMVLRVMALLVVLKLIATAMCYASGNAGGIFGPSLFIGAMMGGAVGGAAHLMLPDYTGSVGAYALVGMGAAFAGIIRVPLTSVIMIFEVTRDYTIIVPLMIANLISYFISSRLQEEPIYEALLHQDGITLPAGARSRDELLTVEKAVRPAAGAIPATDTIEDALSCAQSDQMAWLLVGSGGLLGIVSRDQLLQAASLGRGHESVGSLLPLERDWDTVTAESFPHVHLDQPLDTAMRRMALSGLDTLPVVSRANVRELEGIISMRDVLDAYGSRKPEEAPYKESRTPIVLLGGLLAVLIAMVALGGFLNYYYRAQRSERAKQYFLDGNQLMAKERYQDASEQYRDALSISHSARDRLALAQALQKGGHPGEAEVYFREVLRDSPNSGPANLGLAREATDRNNVQEAVNYYHRAIYGSWPEQNEVHRIQTRIELIGVLGKSGKRREAQASVLALESEIPNNDVALRKQLGQLLLDYGLPEESAGVYRKVIENDRQDAGALMGLGEAELAQNRYRAAQGAFTAVLHLRSDDTAAANRLQLIGQILALDPAVRGLSAGERYQRSRKLLEAALGSLDECLGMTKGAPPEPVEKLSDTVRKVLLHRAAPRSYGDSTEDNIDLAEQLWKARTELCGQSKKPDEPINRAMAQLSK